jgi:hypothetical protein
LVLFVFIGKTECAFGKELQVGIELHLLLIHTVDLGLHLG